MSDVALPSEMWAGVCEYLPFRSVLSLSTASRAMLRDAIPKVAMLHIDHSREINPVAASRFRDVREIRINSLLLYRLRRNGSARIEVDFDTKIRVVPFLSIFRNRLRRVCFGGKDERGVVKRFPPTEAKFSSRDEGYPNEGARERMLAFLDSVSGAFRSGAFPQNLEVLGLCCPDSRLAARRSGDCETCLRACNSFPLESALCFECDGSSIEENQSGRFHGLDVCLERAQIDSVLESRPGGHALLYSEERLLKLLSRGRRYEIASADGKSFCIVNYTKLQLSGIKRAIDYAGLDVKKLPVGKISSAVMRSFAKDDDTSMPLPKQCHLSEASIDSLSNEFGLSISTDDFCRNSSDLIPFAHQIALTFVSCSEDEHSQYVDIKSDCLKLLMCVLDVERNPQVDEISCAIPGLVNFMKGKNRRDRNWKTNVAKNIFLNGTNAHKVMLLDAGVMPHFSRLVVSPKSTDSAVKDAVISLAHMARWGRGNKDQIETMVNAADGMVHAKGRLLTKLEDLLVSSSDYIGEENILRLLVAVKHHIAISTRLLPHLLYLSLEKTSEDYSILLRRVLSVASQYNVQKIINLESILSLIEVITKTQNHAVWTNLSHAVMLLAAKAGDHMLALGTAQKRIFFFVIATLAESESCITHNSIFGGITHNSIFVSALLNLLKGLNYAKPLANDLLRLVRPLIMIIPRIFTMDEASGAAREKKEDALQALCLLAAFGEEIVQQIVLCNGIVLVRELLSSSFEEVQLHACRAISIIINGNRDRLQDIIDHHVVARLIIEGSNFEHDESKKISFMMPICLATQVATAAQIEFLVHQGCIRRLCGIVFAECKPNNIAIRALKNILNVGIEKTSSVQSTSSDIENIEGLLDEWAEENLQFGRDVKNLELLNSKKTLLEVNYQYERVMTLKEDFAEITSQESYTEKILKKKKRCEELRQEKEVLKTLEDKAKQIVPKNEWHAWLAKNSYLPRDMKAVMKAVEEASSRVSCIRAKRANRRTADMNVVASKLTAMFVMDVDMDMMSSKRHGSDVAAAPKKRTNNEEDLTVGDGSETNDGDIATMASTRKKRRAA